MKSCPSPSREELAKSKSEMEKMQEQLNENQVLSLIELSWRGEIWTTYPSRKLLSCYQTKINLGKVSFQYQAAREELEKQQNELKELLEEQKNQQSMEEEERAKLQEEIEAKQKEIEEMRSV